MAEFQSPAFFEDVLRLELSIKRIGETQSVTYLYNYFWTWGCSGNLRIGLRLLFTLLSFPWRLEKSPSVHIRALLGEFSIQGIISSCPAVRIQCRLIIHAATSWMSPCESIDSPQVIGFHHATIVWLFVTLAIVVAANRKKSCCESNKRQRQRLHNWKISPRWKVRSRRPGSESRAIVLKVILQ